jgi:phenylacetate-CoA ligase
MGRADQTTKIRGMFVHPTQAGDVAKRHPEVSKIRIEVTTKNNLDDMVVKCEAKQAGEALATAIAESVVAVCKVRGRVELVAPGSLPDDGKVIADLRTYT